MKSFLFSKPTQKSENNARIKQKSSLLIAAVIAFFYSEFTYSQCTVNYSYTGEVALSLTCSSQVLGSGNGLGAGQRRTYTGFVAGTTVQLYLNTSGMPISCVNAQWQNATGTLTGAFFSINFGNSVPGIYTNQTVPPGADRLVITTGNSGAAWVPTSAVLNYLNAAPAAVTVSSGSNVCSGSNLTATGGTGGTIYWQNTTTNGTNIGTPSTSQPVTANGTYHFRARSNEGCWGTQGSSTVTLKPGPSVNAGADVSICSGSNTSLNGSITVPPILGINYLEDFTNCSTASCNNWAISGGVSPLITATTGTGYSPCTGPSAKSNIYGSSLTTTLTSTTGIGNSSGEMATFSFTYKCIDYSNGNATAANSCTFRVEWGTDGVNWSQVGTTFNNSSSTSCQSSPIFTFTPPAGSNIRMRIIATRNNGDFWAVMDNISLTQPVSPPQISWSGTPITNPTTLTPTVNPTATTTYTLSVTANGCTATDDVLVTVNPVATPTFTSVNPSTNVCLGTNVTYTTQSGKTNYVWTIPGTAGTDYTLVSGGTSTSNTAVIAWKSSAANTAVRVNYEENGCLGVTAATATVISLPTQYEVLSTGNTATCYVNGYNPVLFYDVAGNFIGSINPQGRSGNVTMTSNVGTPAIQGACSMPTNPAYMTAYMGRIIHVDGSALTGSGNVNVVLGYGNAELLALQTLAGNGSGGSTPGNTADDITNLLAPNLGITKVEGNGALCAGNVVSFITPSEGVLSAPAISNARYVNFSVANFSTFYIHGINNNSPLPVTLTNFSANCEKQVQLNWTTASEQNSDHFIIEKSRDGEAWSYVNEEPAAGNSNAVIHYTQEDQNTWNGISYYRLRQIDLNGEEALYGPISIACSGNDNNRMTVYPNPNNGVFTIEISSVDAHEGVQLLFTDMTGRTVVSQMVNITAGTNQLMIDNGQLQMGTYMISVIGIDNELKPVKMVVNN